MSGDLILCERPDPDGRPCHVYLGRIAELEGELAACGTLLQNVINDHPAALSGGSTVYNTAAAWLARTAAGTANSATCTWTDEGEAYSGECGIMWTFLDGGPVENKCVYCMGCGRRIRTVAESCDTCASQEGRHYCLLRTEQIKNMDLFICSEWTPKGNEPTECPERKT